MIKKFKNITQKKYFRRITIIIMVTIMLFILGMIFLRYQVEGETNMPFALSKISIISSCEGIDKANTSSRWEFDVCQNNDIYLYIDKNQNYHKAESIQYIEINNIQIETKKEEYIKIYKPDEQEEKVIFKNKIENNVSSITYRGDLESDIKKLKISNQGGLIAIRCSNEKVAEVSSEEEEMNHDELLKKAGVAKQDLEIKMTFDLIIQLEGAKQYKTTIDLDFPVDNVIEEGTTSREITDLKKFVFKRM